MPQADARGLIATLTALAPMSATTGWPSPLNHDHVSSSSDPNTHSSFRPVSCSKTPSGRSVRALSARTLGVEGIGKRRNNDYGVGLAVAPYILKPAARYLELSLRSRTGCTRVTHFFVGYVFPSVVLARVIPAGWGTV